MTFASARLDRAQKLVLALMAVVLVTGVLAALTPTTAQAGEAKRDGRLIAAIYNDSPVRMEYVQGWSQFGFNITPSSVDVEGAELFEVNGSPVVATTANDPDPCWWYNSYNGWFTYKLTEPHTSTVEYMTFEIHGDRKYGDAGYFCTYNDQPALNVHQTSTPPPLTWRWNHGAPSNVIADPKFAYQHNVPYLFDQTITWDGEGPGDGVPTIVSIGDSTISGEGGRWAGNTNEVSSSRVDAGSTWYWDVPGVGESERDCHRSKSAMVHVGAHVRTKNFACSGAETSSYDWEYALRGWRYKPGIDEACSSTNAATYVGAGATCRPQGKTGQLGMLETFAKVHNVRHVVLAIGANDFNFSGIIQQCILRYIEQPFARSCDADGVLQAAVSAQKKEAIRSRIVNALIRVTHTMRDAGYQPWQYDLILQNYWSANANDADMRIADEGTDRMRLGGCPLMYGDATMMNKTLLRGINDTVLAAARSFSSLQGMQPLLRFLDVSEALKGHRLCEKGALVLEDVPGGSGKAGTDPFFAGKVEWVTQMRLDTAGTEYMGAEGGHANYWGQLALRSCLRELIGSNYYGGKCTPNPIGGTNNRGEPEMMLTAKNQWYL